MHTQVAHEAWVDLEYRYKQSNAPKMNQIKYELSQLQQGTSSVSDFYDKFKSVWEQFVDVDKCKFCSDCMKIYQEKLETDRVHQFLLGLNNDFMNLRTQILSQDSLPNMSKILGLVIQEEKQRYNFRENNTQKVHDSAFFAQKDDKTVDATRKRGMYAKSGKKLDTRFYCDNCKFYGHERKNCWHLIGHPKDRDKNKKKYTEKKIQEAETASANQVSAQQTSASTNISLTPEEIQMFKHFLAKTNGMDFSFHINYFKFEWIIDTGASQHMSGNLSLFSTPLAKQKNQFVTIPSGQIFSINGVGSIILSENIILKDVLYIPEFKVNLIAVSKLTLDNDIRVIFYNHNCQF